MAQILEPAASNMATTGDWLEASKRLSIRAYVEPQAGTHVEEGQPVPRGDVRRAIKTVGRRAKSD